MGCFIDPNRDIFFSFSFCVESPELHGQPELSKGPVGVHQLALGALKCVGVHLYKLLNSWFVVKQGLSNWPLP